ncbi:MAG TPA: hypothetical protein VF570_19395 [Pyrinomonadaceae bacterium]|jgi:hypothetical protein
MKIEQRIKLIQAAVAVDKAKGRGDLGEQVGKAAEAAMLGGIASEAWKKYMSLFADSAEQLTRLTTNELDGDNDYLPRMRAYIVANGVCAPGTDAATMKGFAGLGGMIDAPGPNDEPLKTDPEDAVVKFRPFPIPEV